MKKIILVLMCICLVQISQSQIPSYVPKDSLVGWWPFNGNANDESGNGHNGNSKNTTLTTDRLGKSNAAFFFNGQENSNGSQITTDSFFNIGWKQYSISFWFKLNNLSQVTRCIINTSPHTGIGINFNDNNTPQHLSCMIGPGTSFWNSSREHGSFTSWDTSKWYNAVLTKNGTTFNQYLNGKLTNTFVVSQASTYNAITRLLFSGIGPTLQIFHGKIDDIGVWKRNLDSNEIKNLWESTTSSDSFNRCESCISADSALVGCWQFNGNAKDRLSNHKEGIVHGATLTSERFGNTNSAYFFDGKSYIEIPDSFKVTRNYSISCWVKPNYYTSWDWRDWLGILSDGSTRERPGYDMFIGIKNDKLIHRADKPFAKDYSDYQYDYTFDSLWYHILWVCGDSGQIVYVNGKNIGSTKDRGGNQGYHDKSALFGAWNYNSRSRCDSLDLKNHPEMCQPHNNFYGKIDDIKMWRTLLDSTQVKKVYECKAKITGTTPIQLNLIKVYPNPAKDYLIIDFGNYSSMAGYEINILDAVGKSVYNSTINKAIETIDLNTWAGKGIYFIQIFDKQSNRIENRKIVIQ